MTPIKSIILFGVMILVEDMAGGIELKASCPNERDADWIAGGLATFHGVELRRTDTMQMPSLAFVVAAK